MKASRSARVHYRNTKNYFTDVNTLGSQCVHIILWLNL